MGLLNDLKSGELNSGVEVGLKGLKILIYGGNTLGKTPNAMKFPKPLLLMGESGGGAIAGNKIPIPDKKEWLRVTNELTDKKNLKEMQEEVKTIVIDCIEDIIELYELALCRQYGVSDVGQIQQLEKGNPNGYSVYRKEFKQQINKLTQVGYTVVFIAHEEKLTMQNDGIDWIVPKGSKGDKGSSRFIRDLCDFRFYIKGNGIDEETGEEILSTAYCVQTSDFYAGSRFPMPTYVNPFTAERIIEEIEKSQQKAHETQGGKVKEFKADTTDLTKEDYVSLIKPYYVKLAKLYKEEVLHIVYSQLGEGALVSSATEEQLVELDVIYTSLIQLACDKGVVIEV